MEQWNALGKWNDSSHTIGCSHWRGRWTISIRSRDDQVILFQSLISTKYSVSLIFSMSDSVYPARADNSPGTDWWDPPPRFAMVKTTFFEECEDYITPHSDNEPKFWYGTELRMDINSQSSRNGYCQCTGNNLTTDSCYTSMLFDIFDPTILCRHFSICKTISNTWQRQILANEIVSYD